MCKRVQGHKGIDYTVMLLIMPPEKKDNSFIMLKSSAPKSIPTIFALKMPVITSVCQVRRLISRVGTEKNHPAKIGFFMWVLLFFFQEVFLLFFQVLLARLIFACLDSSITLYNCTWT